MAKSEGKTNKIGPQGQRVRKAMARQNNDNNNNANSNETAAAAATVDALLASADGDDGKVTTVEAARKIDPPQSKVSGERPPLSVPAPTLATTSRHEVNALNRDASTVPPTDFDFQFRTLRSGRKPSPPPMSPRKKQQSRYFPNMAVPTVTETINKSLPPAVIGGSTFVEHVEELSTMDEVDGNETTKIPETVKNPAEIQKTSTVKELTEKETTQPMEPLVQQAQTASDQNEIETTEVEERKNNKEDTPNQQESRISVDLDLHEDVSDDDINYKELVGNQIIHSPNSKDNSFDTLLLQTHEGAKEDLRLDDQGETIQLTAETAESKSDGYTLEMLVAATDIITEKSKTTESHNRQEIVYGSVHWCACLELCHIKNQPSDNLKHSCTSCLFGLHPICGYKNDQNDMLCYKCVYQDEEFVQVNNFRPVNETLIWKNKIVDYFEKKPPSRQNQSIQGSVEVEAMNEDNESKISETLEEFSINSQDVEMIDVEEDDVVVIENPNWSQRSKVNSDSNKRVSYTSDDTATLKKTLELEDNMATYITYRIEYLYSVSVPDSRVLNDVVRRLFGKEPEKVSVKDMHGMCTFLEKSYLHDFKYPILSILEFDVDEQTKTVRVNCEGINVMLILLCPQEVDHFETLENNRKGFSVKRGDPFLYKTLNFKSTPSDGEKMILEIRDNQLGTVTSDFAANNWIAINHKCSLPWMYLTHPCGFCLQMNPSNGQMFVYIYLSLSTKSNCKRIRYNEDRMTGIVKSLTDTNQKPDAGKSVDGTQVMLHPYSIEELSDARREKADKEFDVCSPLSNCAASIDQDDNFANKKYGASLAKSTNLSSLLAALFNVKGIEDLCKDVPTSDPKNNKKLMYEVLVYLNLFELVGQKYGYFRSRLSFIDLFYDLVEYVKKQIGFEFPLHHVQESNIVHIARILFRYVAPKTGLMFLDGNCRNYSACVAYSRSSQMNSFLCEPIKKECSLKEPNYEECAKLLLCDYLVHPFSISNSEETFPYADVKHQYVQLSEYAYNISTSANQMSMQQIADKFFVAFHSGQNQHIYKPQDTQKKWSEKLIEKNFEWQLDHVRKKNSKEKNKKRKRKKKAKIDEEAEDADGDQGSWQNFINLYHVNLKRYMFYSFIHEKHHELYSVHRNETLYLPFFKDLRYERKKEDDKTYEKRFSRYCTKADPLMKRVKIFEKTNILITMGRYLSVLVCNGKDEIGDLLKTLRILVSTNGVFDDTVKSNEKFSVQLRKAWPKKDSEENTHRLEFLGVYGGILPSKKEDENLNSYALYSRAFTALYYSPTISWAMVLSRTVFLFSSFNVREQVLFDRCIYSAYRDILDLYVAFKGPLLPVSKATLDKKDKYYAFGWLMSLDLFQNEKGYHFPADFHIYELDLEMLDKNKRGRHFSSNIPTFVMLISLAILLYEANEYQWLCEKTVHFQVENDCYILRSNARMIKKLFGTKNAKADEEVVVLPKNEEEVRNPSYEEEFRSVKRKASFHKPTEIDYLKDLQLKFAFVTVAESRKDDGSLDSKCNWMTLGELAADLFSKEYDGSHPFYNLDKSFLGIVKYLSNPINAMNLMISPKHLLEKISQRPKLAAAKKEMLQTIYEIVGNNFSPSSGVGGRNKAEVRDVMARPKAFQFTSTDKKLFNSIVEVCGEENAQNSGRRPSDITKASRRQISLKNVKKTKQQEEEEASKLSLLQLATVYGEKMVTCIAMSKFSSVSDPCKIFSDKMFKNVDSGKYGTGSIFDNIASDIVRSVYLCHYNNDFHDECKKICDKVDEKQWDEVENSSNDGDEDAGEKVAQAKFDNLMESAFGGELRNKFNLFPEKDEEDKDALANVLSVDVDKIYNTFDVMKKIDESVEKLKQEKKEKGLEQVPASAVEEILDPVLAETEGYIPVKEHVPDRIGKPVRARRKRNSVQGTEGKKESRRNSVNTEVSEDMIVTSPTEGELDAAVQLLSPQALSHEAGETRRIVDSSPLSIVQAELGSIRVHVRVPIPSDVADHGNSLSVANAADTQTNSVAKVSDQNTNSAAEIVFAVGGMDKKENIFSISENDMITVATEHNKSIVSLTQKWTKRFHGHLKDFESQKNNSGGFGLFDLLLDIKVPLEKFVQVPQRLKAVANQWQKANRSSLSSVVFGVISSNNEFQAYTVLASDDLGELVLRKQMCVIFVAKTDQLMDMYQQTICELHDSAYIPYRSSLCFDNRTDPHMFPFFESKLWQIHPALLLVPKDEGSDQGQTMEGQVCAAGPMCVFVDQKGSTGSVSSTAPAVPPYFVCRICEKQMHACCGYFSIMVSFVCANCGERENKADVVSKRSENDVSM